jgi:hypothetical protein
LPLNLDCPTLFDALQNGAQIKKVDNTVEAEKSKSNPLSQPNQRLGFDVASKGPQKELLDHGPVQSKRDYDRSKLYTGSSAKYLSYWEERGAIMSEAWQERNEYKKKLDEFYGDTRKDLVRDIREVEQKIRLEKGSIFSKKSELRMELHTLQKSLKQFYHTFQGQQARKEKEISKTYATRMEELNRKYDIQPTATHSTPPFRKDQDNEKTSNMDFEP